MSNHTPTRSTFSRLAGNHCVLPLVVLLKSGIHAQDLVEWGQIFLCLSRLYPCKVYRENHKRC